MIVKPIKDKKKIDYLLMYLKGGSERDYLLCKFQLNTGLRISDVVKVKVEDLLTPKMNFKDYFVLHEKKTGKEKKKKLNDTLKKALKAFIKQNSLGQDKYLSNRKGINKPISVTQVYRILKAAIVNVNIENFGTPA
jgi:integrase